MIAMLIAIIIVEACMIVTYHAVLYETEERLEKEIEQNEKLTKKLEKENE